MMKHIISICLMLIGSTFIYCQIENEGIYSVGFTSYTTVDTTRNYIVGSDTVNRPLLIHHWYPGQENAAFQSMTFKNYIDLIALREDFDKNQKEIDQISEAFIGAYLGFSQQQFGIDTSITREDVLNSSVKAIYQAKARVGEFPLIIYAPSNSKSAVQNHILCEDLASNGYHVVSVASAGHETLKRYDQRKATLAQVEDMEFMVKYMSDSLKFSAIGLMGFSTGSMATIIYQMQNPAVKAVVSLDGSQEYAFYSILYKMEAFDLARANTPYLMIANKYKDYSVFPYYSSIPAAHKYLYRTTEMDHNGFISYWSQFARCSKHSLTNSFVESYSVLGDCVIHFFDNTLKAGFEHPIEYAIANHELIQKDSTDYTPVAHFLNQVLEDGIESSLAGLQSNEKKYKGKSNMINVVGRMFLGNENDMAIKIFKANAEMHPDSWECFYHLALAYKESNNKEAAKNAIAKAMDLDKNNDEILKLSADIQKMNGA